MSIANELQRIQAAKTDIKTSIEAKGVAVPDTAHLDTYSTYIDQITGGESTDVIPLIDRTVTEFVIPNGTTKIGKYTFAECTGLTSVIIPEGVTEIGDYAFYYCDSLLSITIPSTVTKIGNYAFANCINLIQITSNAVVAPSITNRTFQLVGNNGSLYFPEGSDYSSWLSTSTYYLGYYGWTAPAASFYIEYLTTNGALINVPTTGWGANIKEQKVEDGWCYIYFDGIPTMVPERAFFSATTLSYINLPEGIISIAINAFDSCANLREVDLPNSLRTTGNYAFANCTKLSRINSNVDFMFNIPEGVTTFGQSTFQGCSNVSNVVLPQSLTSIARQLFQNCTKLSSVTIPDTITTINQQAFYGCSNLTSIVLPASVTSLGTAAFTNCSKLVKIISYAATAPTINNNTFQGVAQNGKLIHPMGDDYSSWLSTGTYYLGYYNWTDDNVYFTYETTDKAAIDFIKEGWGANVIYETYKNDAFYVYFDDVPTTVPELCFLSASTVVNITLPEGITTITDHGFRYCTGLYKMTLPESVEKIGGSAFAYCGNLREVYIGSNITTMGTWVFHGTSLREIYMTTPTAPAIQSNVFSGMTTTDGGHLYYPTGSDYSTWKSILSKWKYTELINDNYKPCQFDGASYFDTLVKNKLSGSSPYSYPLIKVKVKRVVADTTRFLCGTRNSNAVSGSTAIGFYSDGVRGQLGNVSLPNYTEKEVGKEYEFYMAAYRYSTSYGRADFKIYDKNRILLETVAPTTNISNFSNSYNFLVGALNNGSAGPITNMMCKDIIEEVQIMNGNTTSINPQYPHTYNVTNVFRFKKNASGEVVMVDAMTGTEYVQQGAGGCTLVE